MDKLTLTSTLGSLPPLRNSLLCLSNFETLIGRARKERDEMIAAYSEMTFGEFIEVLRDLRLILCEKRHEKNRTEPSDCIYKGHAGCGHQELRGSTIEKLRVGNIVLAILQDRNALDASSDIAGIFTQLEEANLLAARIDIAANNAYDPSRSNTLPESQMVFPEIQTAVSLPVIQSAIRCEEKRLGEPLIQLGREIADRITQLICK